MFVIDSFIVVIVALIINIFVILNKDDRRKFTTLIKEKIKKVKGNKVRE